MLKNRMLHACAAVLLIAMPLIMAANSVAETRLHATLTGARINNLAPSGHADYRAREGRARLTVQVEDVSVAPGTVLGVFLDGSKIGEITVEAATLGGAFELNSQDGDLVPSVQAGSLVVVRNGANAVVAGVF